MASHLTNVKDVDHRRHGDNLVEEDLKGQSASRSPDDRAIQPVVPKNRLNLKNNWETKNAYSPLLFSKHNKCKTMWLQAFRKRLKLVEMASIELFFAPTCSILFRFSNTVSREWENYIAISAPQIAHCWHLTSFYIFLRAGLLGLQKWYIPLCKGEISLHWEVWILMSKKSMSCPNFFSAHFLHQGQKVISAALEKFKMRFLSTVDQ